MLSMRQKQREKHVDVVFTPLLDHMAKHVRARGLIVRNGRFHLRAERMSHGLTELAVEAQRHDSEMFDFLLKVLAF